MIYHLKTCCGLDISHYKPNNLTNWYTSPTCWGAYDRSVRTWSYVHLGPGAQFLTCKFLGQMTWWFHQPGKQGEKQTMVTKWLHHQQHKWKKSIWNPFLEWCDPTTSILHYSKDVTGWKIHHRCWSPRQLAQGAGACGQLGHPDTSCLVKVRVGTQNQKWSNMFHPWNMLLQLSILQNFLKNYWCSIFHSHLTEENQLPIPNIPNVQSFSNCTEVVSLQMKMAIPSSRPLHLRLEFVLWICLENWIFSCMDHDRSTAWNIQRNLGWNVKQVLIKAHLIIPIGMCWTLAQDHSIQDDYVQTLGHVSFSHSSSWMTTPRHSWVFFLGGRGWTIVTPTVTFIYLWVNKWSRFHEKSTTWKTSRLEDLPKRNRFCVVIRLMLWMHIKCEKIAP